jgi:sugar/nucleoside kinase (ribokinase family)
LRFQSRTPCFGQPQCLFGEVAVRDDHGVVAAIHRLGWLDLPELRPADEGASVLVANVDEADGLPGLPTAEVALELARVFDTACVTMGVDGAVAASGDRLERAAAPAIPAANALETGDALAGSLVASLARGNNLADALRAGIAAGARAAR